MRKPGRDYEALIADLEESGLSLRAFAEEEDVPPSTLARWRRRLSKEAQEAKPATRFLPVKVAAPLLSGTRPLEGCQVWLRSGHQLHVPSGFDTNTLSALLSSLEPGPCSR
jgi:hypothetical protein